MGKARENENAKIFDIALRGQTPKPAAARGWGPEPKKG